MFGATPADSVFGSCRKSGAATGARRNGRDFHFLFLTCENEDYIHRSRLAAANTTGKTELIVMVPNVRGDDFVDAESFKRFLHATLDSLRGAPTVADMSDAASRDRVIRYFTEIGLR